MYLIILYALLTACGILGVGHYLWSCLKKESHPFFPKSSSLTDFSENIFLTIGISWFIGYFFYEGIICLLATIHIFHPYFITFLNIILICCSFLWLLKNRAAFIKTLKTSTIPAWEIIILSTISLFLLFWNLYPSFDVDSLAFYFNTVQNFILHGGKEYSAFNDIRQTVPVGENYVFALGFAVAYNSTFFAQLIHGLSKVMLMAGAFGAARSFGAGPFALIAAALIMSEEHLLASGANASVRINIPLTYSVFFIGFGLFAFVNAQKREFLFLSLIAVFNLLTCKYIGMNYLVCYLPVVALLLFYRKELRSGLRLSKKKHTFSIIILSACAVFALLAYVYNLIFTGSPFFPAALGPLVPHSYDRVARELARDWHYHLSIPDAIKNVSTFLVWPGVLSSKILLPLAISCSLFAIISKKKDDVFLKYGLIFFVMSILVVILTQTYVVFEMRYYRYGIGIYALSCTFFLAYLFKNILSSKILQNFLPGIAAFFIILVCLYCARYSFDVMGHARPTAKQITNFLTGKETESEIIAARYAHADKTYAQLKIQNPNLTHAAFLLGFDWPQTFYPVPGKNIAYINAGGFSTESYFNEGLFAQNLLDQDINFVFNELATDATYPLVGGAAYNVFTQCGQSAAGQKSFITLSRPCLEKLAKQKDARDAKIRLDNALSAVRALPAYEPFTPPTYGGPSNIIK